jgi:two-component system invasion response regulator UvrY
MRKQACRPENRPLHIVVADGDTNVRFGLSVLLGQRAGFRVQGEAAEAGELLAQMEAGCPDAIVVDWALRGPAMEALLARLRYRCPEVAIVVLSSRLGIKQVALGAGADRFVSKSDPPGELIAAIRGAVASRAGSQKGVEG